MMAEKTSISKKGFSGFVLFFSGVISVILSIIGTYSIEKIEEQYLNQRVGSLDESLDIPIAETAANYFAFKRLQTLIELINSHGPDSRQFDEYVNEIKADNMDIKLFIYSGQELEKTYNASENELKLFSQLMKKMALPGEDFRKAQRDLNLDLLGTLGPGTRLELLRSMKNRMRNITGKGTKGYFYWTELTENRKIFCIISQIPDQFARFECFKKKGTASCQNTGRFGAGVSVSDRWLPPEGIEIDTMRTAYLKAGIEGRFTTEYSDHLWFFAQNASGFIWCAVEKLKDSSPARYYKLAVTLGYLLSALLFSCLVMAYLEFSMTNKITDLLESITIRYRLMTIFLMASMMPLGLSIILGTTTLNDRLEVLKSEITKESLSRLHNLERAYKAKLEEFRRRAVQLRNSNIVRYGPLDDLHAHVDALRDALLIQRLETRDAAAGLIYSTDDPNVHGVSHAMEVFSRIAIKRHASQRMGEALERITPAEILSESIMSSDDSGLAVLLRQRGKVWKFQTGTFPAFWYWDVYPELSTGPAFIAVTHQMETMRRQQVAEMLAKPIADNTDTLSLAMEIARDGFTPNITPALRKSEPDTFLVWAARCRETGRVLSRECNFRSSAYWITIKPELDTGLYVNLDMVRQDTKLKKLIPVRRRLQIASLFALIVSILGAALIARLFILPIGDLNAGIGAIRERDASFRIPLRRRDEFGELASAFNRLLAEMKELQYGKIVQDSLLEMHPPAPEGYEIACMRRSANDLAGDYHDVIEYSVDRWLIVVGDVTGHGISAALAMAMAKASVDYLTLNNTVFPTEGLNKLNALFFRELKPRRKFMTMGCLALNAKTHEFCFENAGHPYPLHFRKAENDISELDSLSLPLGTRKKRMANIISSVILPKDGILMFSDGFFECINPNKEAFGFEKLKQHFTNLMRQDLPAEQILETLFITLDNFRSQGPYPDDVTLLLIKRKA